jgi:hypothetical protein
MRFLSALTIIFLAASQGERATTKANSNSRSKSRSKSRSNSKNRKLKAKSGKLLRLLVIDSQSQMAARAIPPVRVMLACSKYHRRITGAFLTCSSDRHPAF